MKTYTIIIPRFELTIRALDEDAALKEFWNEYSDIQSDPDFPIIKDMTTTTWTKEQE